MINYNGINTNIDEILEDQGYSIPAMESRILNYISNKDKFFNIYFALEGDFSDKKAFIKINKVIESFISDYIIESLDINSEYDYMDTIIEIIENNISYFDSLNEELSYYEEKQRELWKADEDDLNNYYYSTRL